MVLTEASISLVSVGAPGWASPTSSPLPATIEMTVSGGQAAWQSSPAIPDLGLKADLGEKLQHPLNPWRMDQDSEDCSASSLSLVNFSVCGEGAHRVIITKIY